MVHKVHSQNQNFSTNQQQDTNVNMASLQTKSLRNARLRTPPPRHIQLTLMERWEKQYERYLAASAAEQQENTLFVSKMQEAAEKTDHSYGEWMAQQSTSAGFNSEEPFSEYLDSPSEDEADGSLDRKSEQVLTQIKAARDELDALFYSAMQQAAQTNDASYGEYKKRTASLQRASAHEDAQHAQESKSSEHTIHPTSANGFQVQMKPEYGLPDELAGAMHLSSLSRASRRKQHSRALSGISDGALSWKALADIGHDWPVDHFNGDEQPRVKAMRPQRPKSWVQQMQRRARKVSKAQRLRSDGLDSLASYGFVGGADLTLARALRDQTRRNIAEAAIEGTDLDGAIASLDLGEPLIAVDTKASASHAQHCTIDGANIFLPRGRRYGADHSPAKNYVSRRISTKRKQGIVEDSEYSSPEAIRKCARRDEESVCESLCAVLPAAIVESSEAALEQEPEPSPRAPTPKPRRTWWNDLRGHWATRTWRDEQEGTRKSEA